MNKHLTPRKHCAIIKAWADGHTIQYRLTGKWLDIALGVPQFCDDMEYRIKPAMPKYRRYIQHYIDGGKPGVQVIMDWENSFNPEEKKGFGGWIDTEWLSMPENVTVFILKE